MVDLDETKKTLLRSALHRIEEATEPSRKLDYAICALLRDDTDEEDVSYDQVFECAEEEGVGPPRITASIDAIVSVVERILPKWHWEIDAAGGAMLREADSTFSWADHLGFAKTPALAMCAALLTALLDIDSTEGGSDEEDDAGDDDSNSADRV